MFLYIILLLMCSWCSVAPASGPVEEGQSTTLTCDVNTAGCPSADVVLEWRAQIAKQVVQIIRCITSQCGGGYSPQNVSATISPTSSTLTINSVSRTDPINMETKWWCAPCSPRPAVTACDKLKVYAKPFSPSCIVTEDTNTGSEDVESVTLACSSSRVYPKAKCSLYKKTNGGSWDKITKTQTVSSTSVSSNPVYYSTGCSVTLTLQELGEGTHSFLGYIYPDVTGGARLVNGSPADKDVTFSFSQVSHTCTTNIVQGYFIGKSARCTCSITSAGNPGGTAQWYRGDNTVGTARVLDVTYDKNSAVQTYTCEAKSPLGRKSGSTLTAKFAFLDTDSVQVAPPSSPIKLCDNNKQDQVLCRISTDNVNPSPTFSFSLDGLLFDKTRTESSDGSFYQRKYSFSQDVGGEYQVFCRVTNTVLSISEDQSTQVVFQKPPPSPPQITIGSQNYQGTAASNMVTLAEGYTGDVTCRVEGGYPDAVYTILECGTRKDTGVENTATLSFKNNPLMKDMDGAECTFTSSHISGCYSNKNTRLTLNVIYPPEVTLARDPTKTRFNKGDHVRFTCFAQGNPDPGLTLTRQRTDEVLTNVQTPTLTFTLDPLECLDTGVYVCSGQNSRGTDSKDISINVRCPQEFSPLFDPLPVIDAVMGTTAQFDIDVYGFPEPSLLSLNKSDNTNITSSGRHRVVYTATDAPFGNVTVTISNIEASDFTNYTLRVGNGVGGALVYTFYLNEVYARNAETRTEEDGINITAITVGVIAVVIITSLVVVIVFLVRKIRTHKQDPGLDLVPMETPDIVTNTQAPENSRPGVYEDIDNVQNANFSPISAGVAPVSRQYRGNTAMPPTTQSAISSASQPPETNQYEIPSDLLLHSGPYDSTSAQDMEPPNIYRRPRADTFSTGHDTQSGQYANVPRQQGETPNSGFQSPYVDMGKTSLPNRNYNNVVVPSLARYQPNNDNRKKAYQNVEVK